jgi:hypothetical protein
MSFDVIPGRRESGEPGIHNHRSGGIAGQSDLRH